MIPKDLQKLLEKAKDIEMTEEDIKKQMVSFAWGNINVDGNVDKQVVEQAYDDMKEEGLL